jgi:hypothetical protein
MGLRTSSSESTLVRAMAAIDPSQPSSPRIASGSRRLPLQSRGKLPPLQHSQQPVAPSQGGLQRLLAERASSNESRSHITQAATLMLIDLSYHQQIISLKKLKGRR